ncbi:MAG: hypothetical protein AAF709_18885 [Pseudomonadota bacterium]
MTLPVQQAQQTSLWSSAIVRINALGFGEQITAAVPFGDHTSPTRIAQPFLESAHGPSDAAWIVAERLNDELLTSGLEDLVESADGEFAAAFDDSMYELDRTDQFLTWLVLYLTSPFGTKARDMMPIFSISFEIWLNQVDPKLLSRLLDFRQICVEYERDLAAA